MIFIKVLIIVCIYACRAKRLREMNATVIRQDSGAYPSNPHNVSDLCAHVTSIPLIILSCLLSSLQQRSAIINFEETPQPIINVPPGTDPNTMNPMMAPPPYNLVTQGGLKNEKPPDYEQIISEGDLPPYGVHYGEPATSQVLPPVDSQQVATASASDSPRT